MFNTNTYFGTDGSLTVNSQAEPAAGVIGRFLDTGGSVGRVIGVSVHVTTEVKAQYEIGSRAPKELRAGNIAIGGAVDRAYINGAMLRLMLGQYAETAEAIGFPIPTFNMVLTLNNRLHDGEKGNGVLTVHGAIFDSWQATMPEDDFMLEKLTFKAQRIEVQDKEI